MRTPCWPLPWVRCRLSIVGTAPACDDFGALVLPGEVSNTNQWRTKDPQRGRDG